MRRTNWGSCIVCGDAWAKTKGMCGRHYSQHKDGRNDFSRLIAVWELSQPNTKDYRAYSAAVRGIVKDLKTIDKETRGAFVAHFLEKYEGVRK